MTVLSLESKNARVPKPSKVSLSKIWVYFLCPFEIFFLFFVYGAFVQLRGLARFLYPGKPKSLKGEIILVTGGANGIGREICRQLVTLEKDLTIISWDVDSRKNVETVNELLLLGVRRIIGATVDVSDRAQVEAGAQQIRKEIGDVTMLFNNAGIVGEFKEGWTQDPSITERVFGINVLSHCWTLREFLPAMIQKRKGHVVELCSVLGFTPISNGSVYVASKHAVQGYIESIKEDLRRLLPSSGALLHFTLVYPHNTVTDMTSNVDFRPSRYRFLGPKMTPAYVAKEIISGLRYNKEHIYIPGYLRLWQICMTCLSPEVVRKFRDFAGINPSIRNEKAESV